MPVDAPERSLSFPADFRIGDWLVEPSLDRLSRGDTVMHLRTQLMNLLVLLARNAGRTVSKEEILATIWEGQFVAESGMTRCMAEIRQALGDDARDPKILQTITKRGYRLVAPVCWVVCDATDSSRLPTTPPVTTAPLVAPAAAADAPAGASACGPVAREPMPSLPENGEGGLPRPTVERPTLRVAGWTLASLLTLAGVSALAWIAAGWIRAPLLSERDTVLLADVANTTGDPAFDQTLRLALGMHLGQAPFLHILPDSRMRTGLSYMGRPRNQAVTAAVALELCRREGATVLLAGSITRLGSHYAFGLEGINCSSGESIGRDVIEVANKDGVLGAVGAAATRMRRTLGESRAFLRRNDLPIVEATTPSLEALEALSLGDRCRDQERQSDALMYYRRATDLDPQFAVAWARRGAAAHNMGRVVGDDRSAETEETMISFQRAFELSDRVSEVEKLYIRAHYYRFVVGDADRAIDLYRTWMRAYPGSVVPTTNLASIYVNTLGLYEEALIHAREAVRLAPSSSIANGTLVAALLGSNRLQEAEQALREAARKGVNDLLWHRLTFELAITMDDAGAMREQVRWASGDAAASMVMSECQAMAAASRGRLQEARRHWADAAASAAKVGTAGIRAGCLLRQVEVEVLLGDPRRARAAAEQALGLDGQPTTRLAAATVFASAGHSSRAARLLNDVTSAGALTGPSRYVWLPLARALALSGSGQPDTALEVLQPTARFERGRFFGLVPLGVRASVARSAGHPEEAAALFRDLLRLSSVVPMSPWVSYARLGLARALHEARDIDGSRAAYEGLLDWMKSADADSPILIAARRERAALQ